MQTLSNVPIEEVRVGDRVKSKKTNREGFISQIIDIEYSQRQDDNSFIIRWENGNISLQLQLDYTNVWLM